MSPGTKVSPRPIGLTSQESLWDRYDGEKQMTAADTPLTGASPKVASWDDIDWRAIEQQVQRLQIRIAKATRERRRGKVKALQWLLTHARSAKLLAVRRVTRSLAATRPGWTALSGKPQRRNLGPPGHCSAEVIVRYHFGGSTSPRRTASFGPLVFLGRFQG